MDKWNVTVAFDDDTYVIGVQCNECKWVEWDDNDPANYPAKKEDWDPTLADLIKLTENHEHKETV